MNTNLIERMENLIASLDEIGEELDTLSGQRINFAHDRLEDARGIAGEVLTMIDGR